MIGRIQERIWRLWHGRQKKSRRKPVLPYAPVKGSLKSMIVVKPENGVFSEAVFILSDEYLRSRKDLTQELLNQAGEAAAEYMQTVYLPRRSSSK